MPETKIFQFQESVEDCLDCQGMGTGLTPDAEVLRAVPPLTRFDPVNALVGAREAAPNKGHPPTCAHIVGKGSTRGKRYSRHE